MRNNELAPKKGSGFRFELPEDSERKLELAGRILRLRSVINFHPKESCRSVETLKEDLERLERRLRHLQSA